MTKCRCGSSETTRHVVAHQTVQKLVDRAQEQSLKGDQPMQLWHIGSDHRHMVAASKDNGESGCVHFDLFWVVESKLCWQFKKLEVEPKVDVEIEVSATIGTVQAIEGTLAIHCDSVLDPARCHVTFKPGEEHADMLMAAKGIDWACMAKCIPAGLQCKKDYICWIINVAPCLVGCLL